VAGSTGQGGVALLLEVGFKTAFRSWGSRASSFTSGEHVMRRSTSRAEQQGLGDYIAAIAHIVRLLAALE